MVLATALLCMSLNVYMEARSEPLLGQIAVAEVTWNRATHNKKNVCSEVVKPYQFSWTTSKLKKNRYGAYTINASSWSPKFVKNKHGKWVDVHVVNERAWIIAQKVAADVMNGMVLPVTAGATYFHADYVHPRWSGNVRYVRKIGRHIFYHTI